MATMFEKMAEQMLLDQAAFDVDMKHLKEEWAQADQEAKAALKADMDALKAKTQAAQARAKADLERRRNETDANRAKRLQIIRDAVEKSKSIIEKLLVSMWISLLLPQYGISLDTGYPQSCQPFCEVCSAGYREAAPLDRFPTGRVAQESGRWAWNPPTLRVRCVFDGFHG